MSYSTEYEYVLQTLRGLVCAFCRRPLDGTDYGSNAGPPDWIVRYYCNATCMCTHSTRLLRRRRRAANRAEVYRRG